MITKRRKAILVLGGTLGLLFAMAAIFAFELGLDNNPDWGRGRFALLGSGLLLLAWAAVEPVRAMIRAAVKTLHDRMERRLDKLAMRRWWRDRAERMDPHRRARLHTWTTAAAIVFTLFAYNWIFTAGRIDDWQSGSRYFHRQAEAFAAGQLHLLEQPGPELMAAENPYFYLDRGEIPVLWDALFYDGKYYLYWGPVPGLIVAFLQPLTAERIRDSFLVGAFMAGYLGFAAALLLALRRRFDWFPAQILPGALLAMTLPGPLVWLFTRPNVYEAAIAGGQFFLMGGLFFAFTAFTHEPASGPRLALAGLFWGLAANTRVNLALAIACAGLLVSLRIWLISKVGLEPLRKTIRLGLAFGLPLLASAGGLMVYNQARFGSPFDFGYEYLVTGPTIPEDPSRRTSTDYIVPNTFQYFIRPPEIRGEFPYVVVPWIKNDMWPNALRLPPDYFYTEPVASLLLTVPLIGFGLLAAGRKVWLRLNGFAQPDRIPAGDRGLLNWLVVVLAGNIAFTVPVLLTFTQNTYRYLADLTPAAVLLSVLVFTGLQTAPAGPERSFWRICWMLGAFLAPIFGILIAVTGYQDAFERLNPGLYDRLVAFFPPW